MQPALRLVQREVEDRAHIPQDRVFPAAQSLFSQLPRSKSVNAGGNIRAFLVWVTFSPCACSVFQMLLQMQTS